MNKTKEISRLIIELKQIIANKRKKALYNLCDLGKEIWQGIDPIEYQRNERKGW